MTIISYSIGDTVKLNSGGPPLTIIAILDNSLLLVTWFEGANACRGKFPSVCVEKYIKEIKNEV